MRERLVWIWVCMASVLLAGCASYVTPGGPANLQDIDRPDIAEAAARRPSPNFPARLAIARVQASGYQSHSQQAQVDGRYSVVTARELLSEADIQILSERPQLAGIAPLNRLLLPPRTDSFDDLRLAAAKVQADVLFVYTMDTVFRVEGRGYGPVSALSLGLIPDRDAKVLSTASGLFIDVRTGFIYGLAEASAQASGLTNAWSSRDTIDAKRLEAEQQAFDKLVAAAAKTWDGIAQQYAGQ